MQQRGVAAWLLSVYFLGDYFENGSRTFPKTEAEWRPFIAGAKKALALPEQHTLSDFTRDIFIPAVPPA